MRPRPTAKLGIERPDAVGPKRSFTLAANERAHGAVTNQGAPPCACVTRIPARLLIRLVELCSPYTADTLQEWWEQVSRVDMLIFFTSYEV